MKYKIPAGFKQVQQHDHLFESQNSRIHNIESLLQENVELKEIVAAQAIEIAKLRSRLLAVPTVINEDPISIDSTRDLSTNGSIWCTAKSTFAQVAFKPISIPVRPKRIPAKKVLSSAKLATVARPFVTDQDGPSGFKYVYIGRSRKITRADMRSRFKLVGIDNSPILDINFPAHGVIDVLVHLQYVDKLSSIIKKIGAYMLVESEL